MTLISGTPPTTTTVHIIREAALLRSSGVCRTLFGPVDHEQLSRDLNTRLRDISEQDARRWNFDFQCDAPLAPLPGQGGFQWEEAESAAPFYRETTVVCSKKSNPEEEDSVRCGRQKNADEPAALLLSEEIINQENCSSVSNTQEKMMMMSAAEVMLPVRRKRTFSQAASSKASINGTKITDFFVKRRRTSETKNMNILNPSMPISDQTRSQRI